MPHGWTSVTGIVSVWPTKSLIVPVCSVCPAKILFYGQSPALQPVAGKTRIPASRIGSIVSGDSLNSS